MKKNYNLFSLLFFIVACIPFNLMLGQTTTVVGANTVVTYTTSTGSPFTWVCPAGVTSVQVECYGAGGGGGGATSATGRAGGGGAGGAYVQNTSIAVNAGTGYQLTIGAGGIAGTSTAATSNGSAGGNTSGIFGSSTITAIGGAPGMAGSSANGPNGAAGVGSSTGNAGFSGSFNYAGGNGAAGIGGTRSGGGGGAAGSDGVGGNASASAVTGGVAGAGGGAGANGISTGAVGIAGSAPGGGGSGGNTTSATGRNGGAGGVGKMIITYLTPIIPAISSTPSTLTAFTYAEGSGPSTSKTINISAVFLTGFPDNITITGSTNYEVSSDNTTFSGSVTIAYTAATLASTPVYVRLKAGLTAGSYNAENISLSGGGASSTVACSGTVVPPPTTYTWTGATSTDWQVSTNWNPTRTILATTDMLLFNGGVSTVVTNVATQSIAQLSVINNTALELQSAAPVTLTLVGSTGTDLSVESGSSLSLIQATNAITLTLATGTTGSIAGTVTLNTTAHRLTAVDASGLTFQSGGVFNEGATFSGNPFGTTLLNSVVFASGSIFNFYGGSNPFGASQPSTVLVFQTGSNYKHLSSSATPSASGRIYANYEYNPGTGTASCTGSSGLTVDNLAVSSGTLSLGMTSVGTSVKGNISVASAATLNFNPATAGPVDIKGNVTVNSGGILAFNPTLTESVTFSGTSGQLFTNNGTFTNAAGSTITVTNSIPLTLTNGATGTINYNGTLPCALNNSGTFAVTTASPTLTGVINASLLSSSTGGKVTAVSGTMDISAVTLNVSLNPAYNPVPADKITLFSVPSGTITGTPTITWPAGTWHLDTSVAGVVSAVCDLGTAINTAYINLEVTASNGNVSFNSEAGKNIQIYNSVGQRLMSTKTVEGLNTIPVSTRGVVLVKVDNRIAKVIL